MAGSSIGPIMVGLIVAGLGIQYVFAALAAVLAALGIPLNHAIAASIHVPSAKPWPYDPHWHTRVWLLDR
jgi:hypothetical protein